MRFWEINNVSENKAELLIYGPISEMSLFGDSVTPKEFAEDLKNLGDVSEIDIRINSGGGDVFAAHAIYNQLKSHKASVNVYVDGLAASAASVIAMAGDKIYMPSNAMMMIHNPLTIAIGEVKDFEKAIDMLNQAKKSIIASYRVKTGKQHQELSDLMDEETWMIGEDAFEKGFIDEVLDPVEVSATNDNKFIANGVEHDMSQYKSAPVTELTNNFSMGVVASTHQKSIKNSTQKEEEDMDYEKLKNEHPKLFDQVLQEGVSNERERIKAIEDIVLPGNEEVANKAKFETGVSAEQFAMDAIKAEKEKGNQYLANRNDDAVEAGDIHGAPPANNDSQQKEQDSIAEKMANAANKSRGAVK